jgi:peroxiredoxin
MKALIRIIYAVIFLGGSCGLAATSESSPFSFEDLGGTVRYPLDAGNKIAAVLIFYWHDCPVCNSYAPEINRIYGSHTNFAFYIVQVDPDLGLADAKKHAREYDLHPPVLLDGEHRLVEKLKATVTPQAVLVGRDGKILYRGRIDDLYAELGKRRSAARQHDLITALDNIEAGRAVKIKETKAIGCVIQSPRRQTP